MKIKFFQLAILAMLFTSLSIFSQNKAKGTITTQSGEVLSGKIALVPSTKKAEIKTKETTRTVAYSNVKSLSLNQKEYAQIRIENETYLGHLLVDGAAQLYHLGDHYYGFVFKNGGSKKIAWKNNDPALRGTLAVLFKDCNPLREYLNNLALTRVSALIRITQKYNACGREGYAPTTKEINQAKAHKKDVLQLYAGANLSLNSVSFFNASQTESLILPGVQAGIKVSPGFLGNFQNKLFFGLDAGANFSSSHTFPNAPQTAVFKITHYQFSFDTNFYFNSASSIQPFLGVGIGAASDNFEGSYQGDSLDITGGNTFAKLIGGVSFSLKNDAALEAIFQFIPEYENDLTYPKNNSNVPLLVQSRYFQMGLRYRF